MVLKATTEGT